MTYMTKTSTAASEELSTDLLELGAAIESLPAEGREKLTALYARVVESSKRRRRILNLVQDALGQLRVDMKYLMFDLEATRRERDECRRRLDES